MHSEIIYKLHLLEFDFLDDYVTEKISILAHIMFLIQSKKSTNLITYQRNHERPQFASSITDNLTLKRIISETDFALKNVVSNYLPKAKVVIILESFKNSANNNNKDKSTIKSINSKINENNSIVTKADK